MSSAENQALDQRTSTRLRIFAVVLTLLGGSLFLYLLFSVGFEELYAQVTEIGWVGFGLVLLLFLPRVVVRSLAWKLSVHAPYKLRFRDAVEAVVIGEAVSSLVPLGILASGVSKAVAVRNRLPLVVALSSVATENLFYSLITGTFIVFGGATLLLRFDFPGIIQAGLWFVIVFVVVLAILAFIIVIRQVHIISTSCDWLYHRGFLKKWLENGRLHVRLFENIVFDFYRKHPKRFLPIALFESSNHLFGIAEAYVILHGITGKASFMAAFVLESTTRTINVFFKLVPFLVGVDEAATQIVVESLGIAVSVGISIALIRKGRILFWAIVGVFAMIRRGFTFAELQQTPVEET